MTAIGRRQAMTSMVGGVMGGADAINKASLSGVAIGGDPQQYVPGAPSESYFIKQIASRRKAIAERDPTLSHAMAQYSDYSTLKSVSAGWKHALVSADLEKKQAMRGLRGLELEFQMHHPVAYATWKALNT
jgi:hypothetical protein